MPAATSSGVACASRPCNPALLVIGGLALAIEGLAAVAEGFVLVAAAPLPPSIVPTLGVSQEPEAPAPPILPPP